MAQKRMISVSVIESYNFLTMPLSAQALYMHLIANADDDGIVEAYRVMLMVQAKPDDLHILVIKQYATWLDQSRMIIFLNDWLIQNSIRNDRYKPSIYKNLLLTNISTASVRSGQKNKMYVENEQCQTFLTVKNADREQYSIGQINIEQEQTQRAHANITNNNFCQDVKSVNNLNDVVVLCKKCNLEIDEIMAYIEKYGEKYVKTKLLLLSIQKNVKNEGAWLRSALENNYQNKKRER